MEYVEYVEYVESRLPWLRKIAFLLCQDWHRADDVVQSTITLLYVHWAKASRADNLDGYVRTVLTRVFLGERRSGWFRRVDLRAEPVERPVEPVDTATVLAMRAALGGVPPRQRATLVLRYYCDLTVEETAAALGCSVGTVKSQTNRGLTAMRLQMGGETDGRVRGSDAAR